MIKLFLPDEYFKFTGKAIVFKDRLVINPNQVIRQFKEGTRAYCQNSIDMENAFGGIYPELS